LWYFKPSRKNPDFGFLPSPFLPAFVINDHLNRVLENGPSVSFPIQDLHVRSFLISMRKMEQIL
jgi:hypothetical protein